MTSPRIARHADLKRRDAAIDRFLESQTVKRLTTMRLTDAEKDALRGHGNGNITEGVRRLLAWARGE